MAELERHNEEIHRNARAWESKPVLRRCYRRFHEAIAGRLSGLGGQVVELGSGIGNLKETIPNALRTDLFANPWLDQIENAYALSFQSGEVADLILFDVFHHLRYPGRAMREFARVVKPGGRLLLFEPRVSLLGWGVYGLCHPEAVGWGERIPWEAPPDWEAAEIDYYAAQGNATRLFILREMGDCWEPAWRWIDCEQWSALSYVLSGGYSRPQLYPTWSYAGLRRMEKLLDRWPDVFATRMLVVLERSRTGSAMHLPIS